MTGEYKFCTLLPTFATMEGLTFDRRGIGGTWA
nr:MAG TPA_asm: hypothetical protein [Caudoviricetes sp.]